MKLHNIFKPHLIKQSICYSIRRFNLNFMCFQYWDHHFQEWTFEYKYQFEENLEKYINEYRKNLESIKVNKKTKFIKYV